MPPRLKSQGGVCPSACIGMSRRGGPDISSMFCKDPFVVDRSKNVLYDTGSCCSFASHEDLGFWKLAQAAEALSEVQSHGIRGAAHRAAPVTSPHALMAAAEHRMSMFLADQ